MAIGVGRPSTPGPVQLGDQCRGAAVRDHCPARRDVPPERVDTHVDSNPVGRPTTADNVRRTTRLHPQRCQRAIRASCRLDRVTTERPRRFRLGVLRDSTSEFKPLLNVATIRDGGLIFAPRAVPFEESWSYGVARPRGSEARVGVEHITSTTERPKLHWHRSGWTSVSLTGADIPRVGEKFDPLPDHHSTQIASVLVARPWAFPTEAPKRGDQFFVVRSWPMHLGVEISAYFVPQDTSVNIVRSTLPAVGILDGDTERAVIDLRGHGLDAILVFRYRAAWDDAEAAATSVVAGALTIEPRASTRCVALWSGGGTNPPVTIDVPPPVSDFLGAGRSLGPLPTYGG